MSNVNLTHGQRLIGQFNPADNDQVTKLKKLYENVHDVPKAIVRQQKESLTPYPGEIVGVNESTLKLAVMFIKCDESTHDLYTR